MSHILVTGAAGFIGRPLCEIFRQKHHHVTALLRNPTDGAWQDYIVCDLANEKFTRDIFKSVDVVIHLAGIAHLYDTEAEEYKRINTEASVELANTAAMAGVKQFIYISSVKAVADPGEHCVDESWDVYPKDAYGKSKRIAEEKLLSIGKETGMDICILRPALVFGAGVKGNLAKLISAIRQHRFPPIPDFDNKRSMVSVDDLISAIHLCVEAPEANGKIYIVSDNYAYSTNAMYFAIKKELSHKIPKWWVPKWMLLSIAYIGEILTKLTGATMPFDMSVYKRLSGSSCYLSGKIQKELGWKPTKTFFDLLPDIIKRL